MFKVGEFSRIANVPVTRLHYYDRIRLFKPEFADPATGYRYTRTYSRAEIGVATSADGIRWATRRPTLRTSR
jgi:hypothetical protein